MGALNRSLRVVQAAPASHFDRSAGCLREIHSERLTGHCFLHPRAKRGGSCPTTDPEITEKLLRCPHELLMELPEIELSRVFIRERKVFRDAMVEGKGVIECKNRKAKAEIQLLAEEIYDD